jgi:hypothetical protein
MAKSWNVDIPVTEVDVAAQTFTAVINDPNAIIMSSPWLADAVSVTVHMQDGAPMPVEVGSVLLVRTKVSGS